MFSVNDQLVTEKLQIVTKYKTALFGIFSIYAFLLVKELEFLTFFHLLRQIRRVLSAKMASNQLKISQKIDLDSFQGID